jgi:hypothetical protein
MKRKEQNIVIYKTKNGPELIVKFEKETLWLTQAQIAVLFGTQRPAITKHLNNIFKSGELDENSVCSILEHTASDGKKYKTKFYNLDAIISVGYRVNSFRATQFRIWATKVLKNYLVNGYAINEKRLLEQTQKLKEIQNAINIYGSLVNNVAFINSWVCDWNIRRIGSEIPLYPPFQKGEFKGGFFRLL